MLRSVSLRAIALGDKWVIHPERGRAESRGVVGLQYGSVDGSGRIWNYPPKKVKVLYTKLETLLGVS